MKNKLIALGLDGADWKFLMPLISEGRLPVFKRLLETGTHGDLESVYPPVTCPAWKCYSTGRNPGKLGVFWWVNWDRETGRLQYPSGESFGARDVWEYIGEAGGTVGVINMPMTFPPKPVSGFMISGFGAPMDPKFDWNQGYTFPAGLQREIEEKHDYKININHLDHHCKDELVAGVRKVINSRFDVACEQLSRLDVDFLHLTIFYINVLRHYFGTDEAVKQTWEIIDRRLGELVRLGSNLLIFSDHGMMETDVSFAVNTWFKHRGYLVSRPAPGDFVSALDARLGDCFHLRIGGALEFLRDALRKAGLGGLAGRIRLAREYSGTNQIEERIEWSSSALVGLSQGAIYINKKLVGRDLDGFREKIIMQLESLREPKSGKKAVEKVFRKEEAYSGRFLDEAPDLVVLPAEGFEIYGGMGERSFVYDRCRGWTTGNHPRGLFAAMGPDIREGFRVEGMRLLDLAPNILHLCGIGIPCDFDGMVKPEIFRPGSEAALRAVKTVPAAEQSSPAAGYLSAAEAAEMKSKLIGLGYLG